MFVDANHCELKVSEKARTGGEGRSCPICGGLLIPLRSLWRCTRCQHAMCVGCEVEYVPQPTQENR